MTDNCPVICLHHDCSTLSNKTVIHETVSTETFRNYFCENVSIIVFEGQHEPASTLDELGCHIVNVSMFEINLVEIILLVHFLEYISKAAVILGKH